MTIGTGFLLPVLPLFEVSQGSSKTTSSIICLFCPLALQERYGKEAGRPPAASEGEGDPPGGPASPVVAPMPLAEVELKWEMEKEEKRLLWEQLQGLEVNLGLLGLGCQKAGGCPASSW